jgi:hypothetical protein
MTTYTSKFEFTSRQDESGKAIYEGYATIDGQEIALKGNDGQWRCLHSKHEAALALFDEEYCGLSGPEKEAVREVVVELVSREYADMLGRVDADTEDPQNRGDATVVAIADQCEALAGAEEFGARILPLGKCRLKSDGAAREYGVLMNLTRNKKGKQVAYLNLFVKKANAFGHSRWEQARLGRKGNTLAYMSATSGLWNWSDAVARWIDVVSADKDGCERSLEEVRRLVGEDHVLFRIMNTFG